jgi:hypothetical protein
MNLLGVKAQIQGFLWPNRTNGRLSKTAKLSIPAGLDWIIKQRLATVIAYTLTDSRSTLHRTEDLSTLSLALGQNERRDIYQVTLYGSELAVLYSFLIEQERQYWVWSPGLVPQWACERIRTDLYELIARLRMLCRAIDPLVNRP